MKKLLFSLILCFILLGSSITFSACKDKKFKLSNMNDKYVAAVSNYENVKLTDKGLTFVYSEKFTQEIYSNLPYSNIKNFYTPMLNYSMSFINGYIKKCSSNEIKSTKEQRRNIEIAIDNLALSVADVDSNITTVSKLVDIDASSTSAHIKLQDLFLAYENLYQSAFTLSNYLQEIYFNYAADYNTNPSVTTVNKFDYDKHIILLNAKIANAKVELTEVFIEKYIRDFDYSSKLTEKTNDEFNSLPAEFESFNNKIKTIDKVVNSAIASKIIEENKIKKQNFYNLCIENYNLELSMKDHNPMFKNSKNTIVYNNELNNVNITTENKFHIESMDRYDVLANQYVESIQKIITLLEI